MDGRRTRTALWIASTSAAISAIALALSVFSVTHSPSNEVGRFQQIDSPGHQIAFDTKTGQRCWSWLNEGEKNPGNFQLCSELAKH